MTERYTAEWYEEQRRKGSSLRAAGADQAPDMQCFTCSEMYYSGEGHPKQAMCPACWHPLTAAQTKLLRGMCCGRNIYGRHYVITHQTRDVTGPQFKALRLLASRGHVSLDSDSDSCSLYLRKTAIAALTAWCEEHNAREVKP